MTLKVCFIADAGGHMTEILQLLDAFKDCRIFFIAPHKDVDRDLIMKLPNSYMIRERKLLGPVPTVSCLKIFSILLRERPDIIVSTGSHIAIPAFYFGKLIGAKLIFVECSAQVFTASITGRIVYAITDIFLVQWKSLLQQYGRKAKYVGGLI